MPLQVLLIFFRVSRWPFLVSDISSLANDVLPRCLNHVDPRLENSTDRVVGDLCFVFIKGTHIAWRFGWIHRLLVTSIVVGRQLVLLLELLNIILKLLHALLLNVLNKLIFFLRVLRKLICTVFR